MSHHHTVFEGVEHRIERGCSPKEYPLYNHPMFGITAALDIKSRHPYGVVYPQARRHEQLRFTDTENSLLMGQLMTLGAIAPLLDSRQAIDFDEVVAAGEALIENVAGTSLGSIVDARRDRFSGGY